MGLANMQTCTIVGSELTGSITTTLLCLPDWKKIEEEPPPYGQEVLVYNRYLSKTTKKYYHHYFTARREKDDGLFYCTSSGDVLKDLTHWTTLPIPPQKRNELA